MADGVVKKKKWWHWLVPWRFAAWTSVDMVAAAFVYYHSAPYLQYAGKYYDELWARYENLFEKLDALQEKQEKVVEGLQDLQKKLQKMPYVGKFFKQHQLFKSSVEKDARAAKKSGSTGELIPSLPSWLPKPRTDSAEHFFPDVFVGVLGTIILYRAGKRSIVLTAKSIVRAFKRRAIRNEIKEHSGELEAKYKQEIENIKASVGTIVDEKLHPLEERIVELERKVELRDKMIDKLLQIIAAFQRTQRYDVSTLKRLQLLGQGGAVIIQELRKTHQDMGKEGVDVLATLKVLAKKAMQNVPAKKVAREIPPRAPATRRESQPDLETTQRIKV